MLHWHGAIEFCGIKSKETGGNFGNPISQIKTRNSKQDLTFSQTVFVFTYSLCWWQLLNQNPFRLMTQISIIEMIIMTWFESISKICFSLICVSPFCSNGFIYISIKETVVFFFFFYIEKIDRDRFGF